MSCTIAEDLKINEEGYISNTHRKSVNNLILTLFTMRAISAVFGAAQTVDAQKTVVARGGAVAMSYALNSNLDTMRTLHNISKMP